MAPLWALLGSLEAQDQRAELINRAIFQTDGDRALALLYQAANPSSDLGTISQDQSWDQAVLLMAERLLVNYDRDRLAAGWLRWALREKPGLQPVAGQFTQELFQTWAEMRDSVLAEGPQNPGVQTAYEWGQQPFEGGALRIQIHPSSPSTVTVTVNGTPVAFDSMINVDWNALTQGYGAMVIRAEAPDHYPVVVFREVLPSTTTLLTLTPQALPTREGGGIPVWALIGSVAGVGGVVCLLVCFGEDPRTPAEPTIGSIVIEIPFRRR